MFIQVIRGKVNDEAAMRRQMDRWQSDLRPGASGYLGTTAGFLDGGGFVACARFESEDAAMQNSNRSEQGEWWAETAKAFDGEPTFYNVTDIEQWLDGGSDDAGFVQLMIGHSPDRDALKSRANSDTQALREARPEIIGGLSGNWGDDGYVNIAYFTSEDAARKSEASGPPDDLKDRVDDFQRLLGDVDFLDLHDPIFYSA